MESTTSKTSKCRHVSAARARTSHGFAIGSEQLPSLLEFVECRDHLKQLIGPIPAFVVVVDANVLIGDLLWLSNKRHAPAEVPALLECLVAKTMIARVTTTIVGEVERAMENLSRKRHIPDEIWKSHWIRYKTLLLIDDPDPVAVAKFAGGRDPTDAPTLALAASDANCGILTKDFDIKAMGGKVLPFEFKLDVRDYSRKAAVFVTLQIGGYYIGVFTLETLRDAIRVVKQAIDYYRALPDIVKLLAIIGLLSALLHPKSRAVIVRGVGQIGKMASNVLPVVLGSLVQAAQIAQDNRPTPPAVHHI